MHLPLILCLRKQTQSRVWCPSEVLATQQKRQKDHRFKAIDVILDKLRNTAKIPKAKKDLPTAAGDPAVLGDPKSRRCLGPRELLAVEAEG